MCIIFIYNGLARASSNARHIIKYKLIIAANRDESFIRPASPAHFWNDCSHVLAGQDETVGKEGGTWLGMTRDGRIGMLTNYVRPNTAGQQKRGRGALLANFLGHQSCKECISSIEVDASEYTPFSLVIGDASRAEGASVLHHFCMCSSDKFQDLGEGIHCISNAGIECKWDKVVLGKEMFQELINSPVPDDKTLINCLLHKLLLRDERFSDNDPFMDAYPDAASGIPFSTIFVKTPSYGTRANTIILIDNEDNVTFYERAMQSPIDSANPVWIENEFRFKLEGKSPLLDQPKTT